MTLTRILFAGVLVMVWTLIVLAIVLGAMGR